MMLDSNMDPNPQGLAQLHYVSHGQCRPLHCPGEAYNNKESRMCYCSSCHSMNYQPPCETANQLP